MDNGPELTAWALNSQRGLCATSAGRRAPTPPTSSPARPGRTPTPESFNGRLRDECLNIEEFANLLEARVVLKDPQTDYNTHRSHQSLSGFTPAAYATHRGTTPTNTPITTGPAKGSPSP